MAKSLNLSRMIQSRLVIFVAVVIVLFTKAFIDVNSTLHEGLEYIGYVLIAVCAMGRIYSTAFLGGHKNTTLITVGAFSIVRNPLYFFSFLGMTGIGFVSGHIVLILGIPLCFGFIYHSLMVREEAFLKVHFGQDYIDYMGRTPRFIPDFSKYNAPDTVVVVPNFLKKAFFDAIWWFLPFPAFELIEFLIEKGVIHPFVLIP
jgi:protein-S-isoprenylcysteine O-methyltransferase Ste14